MRKCAKPSPSFKIHSHQGSEDVVQGGGCLAARGGEKMVVGKKMVVAEKMVVKAARKGTMDHRGLLPSCEICGVEDLDARLLPPPPDAPPPPSCSYSAQRQKQVMDGRQVTGDPRHGRCSGRSEMPDKFHPGGCRYGVAPLNMRPLSGGNIAGERRSSVRQGTMNSSAKAQRQEHSVVSARLREARKLRDHAARGSTAMKEDMLRFETYKVETLCQLARERQALQVERESLGSDRTALEQQREELDTEWIRKRGELQRLAESARLALLDRMEGVAELTLKLQAQLEILPTDDHHPHPSTWNSNITDRDACTGKAMKQTFRESPSEKGIRLSVGRRSCAVGVSAKECQVGEALTDTSAHLGSDIAGGQNKAGSQVIRPNIATQSGVSESDTTFQLDKRELGNWPEVRSIRECPRKTKRTSERILGALSPKGAYIGDGGGSSGHGESARTQCIGRIEGGRTNNHLQREHPQSQRRSRCIKSLEVSNAVLIGEIDGLTREEVKNSQYQGAAKMEGCEAVTNVVATREHQRAVRSVEYDGVMSNCSESGCQHSVAHGTVESKFI